MYDDVELLAPLPRPRWPLHPKPFPHEQLDSYVRRLADHYQISPQTFCRHALGGDINLGAFAANPDRMSLQRLSAGTGIPISRLRNMTLWSQERRLTIAMRNFARKFPQLVQKRRF